MLSRLKLLFGFLLIGFISHAQNPLPVQRAPSSVLPTDVNLKISHVLIIPVVADTTTALSHGVDSLGMVIQVASTGMWYKRDTMPGGHFWNQISSGIGGSDSGFVVQRAALSNVPLQKVTDPSGLRRIEWDTSASNHAAIVTQDSRQKLLDSLNAVYRAAFMVNNGGAPGWMVGTFAARPAANTLTAGTHYTATDSAEIFLDTGSGGTAGWKLIAQAPQVFNLFLTQGLKPFHNSSDTAAWGTGSHPLSEADTMDVNRQHMFWYNMLNEAAIVAGDSAWVSKSTGETVKAPFPVTSVSSPSGTISVSPTTGAVHEDLPTSGVTPATYTNATITVDQYGVIHGASTGTLTSTFYRPEDFGGGTSIADNRGPIQSCDSAANADPNKKTCYLGAGIYQVQMASLKSGGPSIGPIHLYSNTTITGAGLQTSIKLIPPPGGASFSPVSAPTTFTSNTNFYSLFEIDSQTNVVIQNMLLNGTLNSQINKDASGTDPVGAPDPYKNPQDGTTTANVQTDGIKIVEGSNNFIYNVEVDSFVGYGVHVVRALNTDIFHINSFGNINGNVYFADSNAAGNPVVQQCAGSILHNSKIIGSYADNVRVIASYIRIEENEIAWSKPRPVSASVNFANLYLQSNLGSGVLGVISTLNYMHDASAFDIDQFQVDTVFSTYKGPSNIITNNTLNNAGAGGVQIALPYVKMANNTLLNEGIRSDGFIDSGSQCHCGVHIATSGWGADIQNNQFLDRNKLMIGGMLTMQSTMPNLTFANNTAVGMTAFSNSVATLYSGPPFNNIHGNQYIDTGGVYHAMFTLDNGGALHITPNAGTNNALPQAVTIDDFSADGQLYIYHLGNSSNIRKGIIGFQSQNGLETKIVGDENGDYLGVGRGTIVGRELLIQDGQTGVNRWGVDSSGAMYVGPGTSTGTGGVGWSMKVLGPQTALSGTQNTVDIWGKTSGSTNFALQAGLNVTLNAGYSGTQGYTVAALYDNLNTANGNSISGAAGWLGNFGSFSKAEGAATSGTNFGQLVFARNALRNVGTIIDMSFGQFNSSSAVSVGLLDYVKRANSSALELGGYIGMGQTSSPTLSNAGLIVDNGPEGVPIQKWQVGNVDKIIVDANAKVDLIQQPDSNSTTSSPVGGVLVRRATDGYVQLGPQLAAGIYVPTATGSANVTSTTADSASWIRIGNTVYVSGVVQITPTATGTTTSITLNTPINTTATVAAITTAGQASAWTTNTVGIVAVSGSNNTVILEYVSPGSAGLNTFNYKYSYQVQ